MVKKKNTIRTVFALLQPRAVVAGWRSSPFLLHYFLMSVLYIYISFPMYVPSLSLFPDYFPTCFISFSYVSLYVFPNVFRCSLFLLFFCLMISVCYPIMFPSLFLFPYVPLLSLCSLFLSEYVLMFSLFYSVLFPFFPIRMCITFI